MGKKAGRRGGEQKEENMPEMEKRWREREEKGAEKRGQ